MRATRNGVSPTTNYVTVEKSRHCHTSSTLVHLRQFDGGLLRLHEADEAAVHLLVTSIVCKSLPWFPGR